MIVVHNKNKIVHTSCVLCGDVLLMIYVFFLSIVDIFSHTTSYK
jgi:hypothetical protein